MLVSILVIIACTVAIWWCSEQLAHGTSTIGEVAKIPPGVRGATLDAVASSFPELCTVAFALIAGHFEAGVGVIAGSALFNILVIPALASLTVGGLVVHPGVVKRDGLFYVGVVVAFILVFYFGDAGSKGPQFRLLPWWSGIAGIVLYAGYVAALVAQTRAGRKRTAQIEASSREQSRSMDAADTASDAGRVVAADDGAISNPAAAGSRRAIMKASGRILVGMAGVGVACHFLVEHGLALFTDLGLSAAVAGVTVLAAATSLPDTLLSVFAARRGDGDGAIANAFASNTFDILICLGLPILIIGDLQMNWDDGWPILFCLLGSSITAVLFMITDWRISRFESVLKIGIYLSFCSAVVLGYL